MKKYIMALDQGTTSSRSIIFDNRGEIIAISRKSFEKICPGPGLVEQDPIEVWESQLFTIKEVIEKSGIEPKDISAIGITNQRETTVCWDKNTGIPVYNAIVWQCRRTADRIEELKESGDMPEISEKTGLTADPYFSATKLEWILDNVPGAREKAMNQELLFGTIDTWLIWNLTGGRAHLTDITNASRTMLFNINTMEWDEELLKLFNIPKTMLPEVRQSIGYFADSDSSVTGVPIPVCGVAGDQQSALFGECCFEEGEVKNTYGTGCFLLANTGKRRIKSGNGLLTTLTAGSTLEEPEYALEGSVFMGGDLLKWLKDVLGLFDDVGTIEEIAESVSDTGGVYIVPAFSGLGAPYWDYNARGIICGLTLATRKEHLIRAGLEAIAFQCVDVINAMRKDTGSSIDELKVDGGVSVNNFLMQFQADIAGASCIIPGCMESTALGAAYMAGLGCGIFKDKEEIRKQAVSEKVFKPEKDPKEAARLVDAWHTCVKRAL